jgi:hypothetical protein
MGWINDAAGCQYLAGDVAQTLCIHGSIRPTCRQRLADHLELKLARECMYVCMFVCVLTRSNIPSRLWCAGFAHKPCAGNNATPADSSKHLHKNKTGCPACQQTSLHLFECVASVIVDLAGCTRHAAQTLCMAVTRIDCKQPQLHVRAAEHYRHIDVHVVRVSMRPALCLAWLCCHVAQTLYKPQVHTM